MAVHFTQAGGERRAQRVGTGEGRVAAEPGGAAVGSHAVARQRQSEPHVLRGARHRRGGDVQVEFCLLIALIA